jgi:hypothetical protein
VLKNRSGENKNARLSLQQACSNRVTYGEPSDGAIYFLVKVSYLPMSYGTDGRVKNTNQLAKEELCLALLE